MNAPRTESGRRLASNYPEEGFGWAIAQIEAEAAGSRRPNPKWREDLRALGFSWDDVNVIAATDVYWGDQEAYRELMELRTAIVGDGCSPIAESGTDDPNDHVALQYGEGICDERDRILALIDARLPAALR